MSDTEIIRTIQVEEKTIELHIILSEAEIRRLLLPHVISVFAAELQRNRAVVRPISTAGTIAPMNAAIIAAEMMQR